MTSIVVFIDTEFTNFNDPKLLSLGMVHSDGQEFYAELDRNDPQAAKTFARASHFVREEAVLPQWGLVPGAAMTRQHMGERVADLLLEWHRAAGRPFSVAFDYPTDWQLLRRLLLFAKRWDEVGALLRPLDISVDTSGPEAQAAAAAMHAQVLAERGLGQHHALADALALRAAFDTQREVPIRPRLLKIPGPVVFLDIDGVLCLGRPYGSFHVGLALKGMLPDAQPMFDRLFTESSKTVIGHLEAIFERRPRYVITSTWRQTFTREQMVQIFKAAGLPGVAAGLEAGPQWCTPFLGGGDRAGEIAQWLQQHYRGEPYVVIDDSLSGWSLLEAVDRCAPQFLGRVVCCEEDVGLLEAHLPDLNEALERPGSP